MAKPGESAIMRFVLLKLSRTGSTSLGMALNTEVSFCKNEILNHWDPAVHGPSQAYIDGILAGANTRIKGFTLNPFKARGVDVGFWSFPAGREHDRLVVLLRRDPWAATVSRIVCKQAGVFPGNAANANAGAVKAVVSGGVRVDPPTFLAAYRKARIKDEQLRRFALEYAKRQAAALCLVRYENVFGADPTDLRTLEEALGIGLDRRHLDPRLKMLPDDCREFIVNHAELEAAAVEHTAEP